MRSSPRTGVSEEVTMLHHTRTNARTLFVSASALLLFLWIGSIAGAQEVGLVEKKTFTLPSYTTVAGQAITNVRLGYETYGQLNARGDNAVFIAHFYSGTSHAAGKYKESDVLPGYWNAVIGPGKAIDTDKYFVVSADTFANLNTKDPNVVTTGPSSVDPATGKPYGLSFPVVAMRDSVRVHKALLDSLGVKKLAAAAGASGGSVQAMDGVGRALPGFRRPRDPRDRPGLRHPSLCGRPAGRVGHAHPA
jgi:hypothetical protein